MRTRIVKPLVALCLAATTVAGVGACSTAKETASKTVGEAVEKAADRTEQGLENLTPEKLTAALDAVAAKVGKVPARFTQISLTGGTIAVEAIDPKKPSELNSWKVSDDAEVDDLSTPVDYGGDVEALRQNAFDSDRVNTKGVIAAIKAAPGAAKIDGGKIMGVTVARNLPFSKEMQSRITVQGPRGTKSVVAAMDGSITSVS